MSAYRYIPMLSVVGIQFNVQLISDSIYN